MMMQSTPIEPLEIQIQRIYPELSATERRLADAMLAQRNALLGCSATDLAALASTSKASAARFFRRLGFADFNAFRAHVRSEASNHAPLGRMAQGSKLKSLQGRLERHVQQDAQCLAGLPNDVNEERLVAAVELLVRARRVAVVGYRNAYTTAFYASALLHQVRPQVTLLNDPSGRDSELLADLGASDLVWVMDLRRRTTRLAKLLGAVKTTGARVLLLSDVRMSTLERHAEVVLRCPTHSGQVFDSYVTAVSLVNFLISEVAARSSKATRLRLSRIEAIHLELSDLDQAR